MPARIAGAILAVTREVMDVGYSFGREDVSRVKEKEDGGCAGYGNDRSAV